MRLKIKDLDLISFDPDLRLKIDYFLFDRFKVKDWNIYNFCFIKSELAL